jgi:hypothetical protein
VSTCTGYYTIIYLYIVRYMYIYEEFGGNDASTSFLTVFL